MKVKIISGRSVAQGRGKESGKFSEQYFQSAAICELSLEDMRILGISDGSNVRITSEFGNVVVKAFTAKQILPNEGELSGIRKGNLQILCEWGQNICVTVVCTNEAAEDEVRSKMRVLADTFEARFDEILEYWNGDPSVFRPVERLVKRYFGSHLHRIEGGAIVRSPTQLYSIDDYGSKAYWDYYRDSKGFRLFVIKNRIPIGEIDKLVNLISDGRLNTDELEQIIEKGVIKLTRESATMALMNLQKREIIYLVS